MVEYKCEKCEKIFDAKGAYIRHINRKNPCDDIGSQCKYCEREFSKRSYMKIHMEKCKEKHPEKAITTINKDSSNDTITNNIKTMNHSTVNNNIIKITINPFLQDDMSKLSDKQKISIMKKCYMALPELIKQVNFNPNIPENHNMYISDIKSKYGRINDGKKWIIEKVDKLVDDVISKKKDDMEDLLDEFADDIPEKVIDKIRDVIETLDYDPLSDDIKDKEKIKFRKKIIDEVKMMLYNNKDVVLETKNKNKKVNVK
jgi:hypothetical protein